MLRLLSVDFERSLNAGPNGCAESDKLLSDPYTCCFSSRAVNICSKSPIVHTRDKNEFLVPWGPWEEASQKIGLVGVGGWGRWLD